MTGADGEDAVAVIETPGEPAFHLKGVELAVKRLEGLLHLFGEQGILPCQLVRGTGASSNETAALYASMVSRRELACFDTVCARCASSQKPA